ncbi:cysteine hydrolase family protein [Alicyclobacillus vulcanalis]|uniref:Nicotinamidase-related amidase n=1 Tax=Alicyclobacillus vulcanalis TaxID=252246 RepID=A0A1N7MB86_9BACL|nr:isochorismatase family cysteine hydrolase [Alicyclobacillus vulcanalis]SIS83385.1 Nicotinamidase-related amidase [Alicyclobacillus vulcanalis]
MALDVKHTALLVMDVQNGIVSRYLQGETTLRPFQDAVEAARQAGMQVIFVRVGFSDGFPEVSPRNKMFSHLAQAGNMTVSSDTTQIHPALAPRPHEPIVTKYRVSAFAGSNLEVILRAKDIKHLVLCGIATSGVVLSTLREAADKDYELTVLKDACLDADPEVHRVLVEKVFPRQAEVTTVAEWTKSLA